MEIASGAQNNLDGNSDELFCDELGVYNDSDDSSVTTELQPDCGLDLTNDS